MQYISLYLDMRAPRARRQPAVNICIDLSIYVSIYRSRYLYIKTNRSHTHTDREQHRIWICGHLKLGGCLRQRQRQQLAVYVYIDLSIYVYTYRSIYRFRYLYINTSSLAAASGSGSANSLQPRHGRPSSTAAAATAAAAEANCEQKRVS